MQYKPGPHVYRLTITDSAGRYDAVVIEGQMDLHQRIERGALVAALIKEWAGRSPRTPVLRLPLRDLSVSGSIDRAR